MAEVLRGYTYSIQDGVIIVFDSDVGTTTGGNARRIVQNMRDVGLPVDALPIIHKDTDGSWAQIVLKGGAFHSFQPLNETRREGATLKAKFQHALDGVETRLSARAIELDAQHAAMRRRHAALEVVLQEIVRLRTAPGVAEAERGYLMFKAASKALAADDQERGNG